MATHIEMLKQIFKLQTEINHITNKIDNIITFIKTYNTIERLSDNHLTIDLTKDNLTNLTSVYQNIRYGSIPIFAESLITGDDIRYTISHNPYSLVECFNDIVENYISPEIVSTIIVMCIYSPQMDVINSDTIAHCIERGRKLIKLLYIDLPEIRLQSTICIIQNVIIAYHASILDWKI